jgi:hypothetical protein
MTASIDGDQQQDGNVSVCRALTCALAGDRGAQAFLYARYADDVYGRVRMIIDDHDTAMDITRTVFTGLGDRPQSGGARPERLLDADRVGP